jgi:hypothetical protein
MRPEPQFSSVVEQVRGEMGKPFSEMQTADLVTPGKEPVYDILVLLPKKGTRRVKEASAGL